MKVLVLGTGSAGFRHLATLRAVEGVEPLAIPQRRTRLVELRAGGFATAPDVRAAAGGACAAIVATDTARHAEDAAGAVVAGLDVLVEKPLSTDARQGRKLCLKAAESGRKVFVGCVLRFSESLNTFRAFLKKVGSLHSVRIECQSYLPDWRPARPYRDSYSARAAEGGVLRDLIHEIDYAGWLFGWPVALQAKVRNLGRLGIEADEAAELLWETADGCVVSVSLDYLSRPSRRYMKAAGERGTLEWNGIANIVTVGLAGTTVEVVESSQTRDEMFLEQARAFVRATQGACDPRLATGEDGVRALAVCDAARRASDTRREERVEYP